MHLAPILAALLRHRLGLALLATQIALTLVIVANAALIVQRELELIARPSGLDEASLFLIEVRPTVDGEILGGDADLAALRALPGVVAATRINALPLGDYGWRTAVDRVPVPAAAQGRASAAGAGGAGAAGGAASEHAGLFYTDEHGPATLGLRLAAGRGFTAADVGQMTTGMHGDVRVAIISRALAEVLFPNASPLGRTVHTRTMPPLTVIGVVERLQSSWPEWPLHEQTLLIAARLELDYARYLVRAAPGERAAAMPVAAARLRALGPGRLVLAPQGYDEIRAAGYRSQRALAIMLTALSLALLFVTGLGIVGTASFWVATRTRQIGTRRALGARRRDILRHFQLENAVISAIGIAAGTLAAFAVNHWLATRYGIPALLPQQVLFGALILLLLGQAAVLLPARRAAAVSPVVASRSS